MRDHNEPNYKELIASNSPFDPVRSGWLQAKKQPRGPVETRQAQKWVAIDEKLNKMRQDLAAGEALLVKIKEGLTENVVHPGEILRDKVLPTYGISINEVSKWGCISRTYLRHLMGCEVSMVWLFASRLERLFGETLTAYDWMTLQITHDRANFEDSQDTKDIVPIGARMFNRIKLTRIKDDPEN